MGSKPRKRKKGKRGKKKKKRRKKSVHGVSDEVLSFPEPEVKRLEGRPLYRQWDDLFIPGKKSFWERWLVCDPPSNQSRKYYAGVDATANVPSMDNLKEQFRQSQLRMSDIKQKEKSPPKKECKLPPIATENGENKNPPIEEIKNPAGKPHPVLTTKQTFVRDVVICEECEVKAATQVCFQCEQNYCDACLLSIHHSDKNLLNHFWEPYKRSNRKEKTSSFARKW